MGGAASWVEEGGLLVGFSCSLEGCKRLRKDLVTWLGCPSGKGFRECGKVGVKICVASVS